MKREVRDSIYRVYLADLAGWRTPERPADKGQDIRSVQGRFVGLRAIIPGMWRALHMLRAVAKGIRYRSLITLEAEQ